MFLFGLRGYKTLLKKANAFSASHFNTLIMHTTMLPHCFVTNFVVTHANVLFFMQIPDSKKNK